jgi:hypothetical protein
MSNDGADIVSDQYDEDPTVLAGVGGKGLLEVIEATHTGTTVEDFNKAVLDWIATAEHPRFKRRYTDLVYQPMEWAAAGSGARFMGLVHHTDAVREYAYDRQSKVGKLDKALDEGRAKGWTIVDMKNDWKVIFPIEMK